VKSNEGAVFRAKNLRTGKEGGLLIWHSGTGDGVGDGHGCWNPTSFTLNTDWLPCDEIELLDYTDMYPLPPETIPIMSYNLLTSTGWDLSGDKIAFGQCGLAGDSWKDLEIELMFNESTVSHVWTDSVNLRYTIYFLNENNNWQVLKDDCRGLVDVPDTVTTGIRLKWENTTLWNTGGLSTYRSGGGLHVDLISPLLSCTASSSPSVLIPSSPSNVPSPGTTSNCPAISKPNVFLAIAVVVVYMST